MTQVLDCGLPEAKVQVYVQNTCIPYIHHPIKSNDFHQFPLMYVIFWDYWRTDYEKINSYDKSYLCELKKRK